MRKVLGYTGVRIGLCCLLIHDTVHLTHPEMTNAAEDCGNLVLAVRVIPSAFVSFREASEQNSTSPLTNALHK